MSQVAACKSPLVKKLVVFLFPVLLAACGGGNNDAAQGGELANPPTPTTGEWQLVWEDDFDGEALNPLNWEVQVGDGSSYGIPGWGNNERQYYTAENLSLADGLLTIEARSEDQGYDYTSGRIRTQGLVDFTYGRVEGRMKLPKGQGLWSAFWMLGSDATAYGTWAARGEIDIVEYFLSGSFGSSVHFGGVAPGNTSVSGIFDEFDVGNEFHTYAVEWDAERIRFFIDGENFYTVTSATYWNYYYKSLGEGFVVGDESAPFDRDQHILLNLAVGGNLPGDPDATTVFPAQMQVDYVRVYECPVNTATGTGCAGSIDPVNYYIDFEVPAQAPVISSYELYSDGPSTLFDETELYRDLTISAYTAEGALSWTEVPDENGELVLDIVTSGGGNVALADANEGSTFRLVNMGDTTNPLSSAEFKFSAKVISSETDSQGRIQFKLDSGFPDVAFYEMSIGDLPQDQWGTVSIRLSDILSGGQGAYGGGPADVNALVNLFVVELTGAAHIQIADLALVCGAPGFCGIEQVAVNPLVIFDNAVGDAWTRGIIGYDTTVDGDYDVAQGNHVSWEIRDSGEEGYEQVIRTTFSDGLASGGVTFIGADSGVDINPWAAGELVFDVRVVSTPNDAPQELIYKLDGPELATTTGERSLGELTVGEWNTFRVPVATLAAYGLDITNVSAFVLFPTFGGQDVVYEWDNVRIETTVTPQPAAAGEIFTSSFEDLTPVAEAEGASIGSGWLTFVSVLGAEGYAYNDGAPFAAPNGGLISQIDVVDGNQVLNVYSDYGNADGQGKGMVTSVFQEYVIGETISGDLVFTFEAYRPEGGLAEGATASAFMTVLDPENNYNLVVQEVLVLNSTLSGEFQTFTVTLPQGSPGLESGLLLQFGFRSETIDYAGTGVLYDNIRLTVDSASGDDEDAGGDDGGDGGGNEPPAAASFEFTADFEAADETAGTIPGWNFFGSDVNGGYGPFAAPNGTGSVANIEGGQGGTEQGDLYLNVFSDYNNGNGNAGPVTAAVFREFTIVASDAGTYRMSVDAKRNDSGPIAAPSIGNVFVKRLDPANGYATVFEENVDVVEISQSEWTTLTIDFTVEASQAGQLIQFGFFNSVQGYAPSSVLYDNVSVSRAAQ
jgi:beta-glucanase (GH16 family)